MTKYSNLQSYNGHTCSSMATYYNISDICSSMATCRAYMLKYGKWQPTIVYWDIYVQRWQLIVIYWTYICSSMATCYVISDTYAQVWQPTIIYWTYMHKNILGQRWQPTFIYQTYNGQVWQPNISYRTDIYAQVWQPVGRICPSMATYFHISDICPTMATYYDISDIYI